MDKQLAAMLRAQERYISAVTSLLKKDKLTAGLDNEDDSFQEDSVVDLAAENLKEITELFAARSKNAIATVDNVKRQVDDLQSALEVVAMCPDPPAPRHAQTMTWEEEFLEILHQHKVVADASEEHEKASSEDLSDLDLSRLELGEEHEKAASEDLSDLGISRLELGEEHEKAVSDNLSDLGISRLELGEEHEKAVSEDLSDLGISGLELGEEHEEAVSENLSYLGISRLELGEEHEEAALEDLSDRDLSRLELGEEHEKAASEDLSDLGLSRIELAWERSRTRLHLKRQKSSAQLRLTQ